MAVIFCCPMIATYIAAMRVFHAGSRALTVGLEHTAKCSAANES